jgi:hypothetical protein
MDKFGSLAGNVLAQRESLHSVAKGIVFDFDGLLYNFESSLVVIQWPNAACREKFVCIPT